MKTRLVAIGNSRGVRLPKALIEQAHLGEEVELEIKGGSLVISASASPRHGWSEAAALLASRGGDLLLDSPRATRFDTEEWEW